MNVGALQAEGVQVAFASAPPTEAKERLAASAGALQADSDEAAPFDGALQAFAGASQAGSNGETADAWTAGATSSLAESSDKPRRDADEESARRGKVVDALMRSASMLRAAGEERLAACLDDQVHRNVREARRLGTKMGQVLRSATNQRKRKILEARAEDTAKRAPRG